MRISHGRVTEAPSENRTETFTGRVWADPVLRAEDEVGVSTVFFEPGARTNWHAHGIGQVL
jgi:quercetin dioxygenase-like cupin family protein